MEYDDLKGRSDEVREKARKERAAQVVPASKAKKSSQPLKLNISDVKTPYVLADYIAKRVDSDLRPISVKGQQFHLTGDSFDQACNRPGISDLVDGIAGWNNELHYTNRVTNGIGVFLEKVDRKVPSKWKWNNPNDRVVFKEFLDAVEAVVHEHVHLIGRGPMSKMNYQSAVGKFFEENTTEYLARRYTVRLLSDSKILDQFTDEFKERVKDHVYYNEPNDSLLRFDELVDLLPTQDKDDMLLSIKTEEGHSNHVIQWIKALMPGDIPAEKRLAAIEIEQKLYVHLQSFAMDGDVTINDIKSLVQEAQDLVK